MGHPAAPHPDRHLFTIIFGKVAKISTDGIPYILFSSVAIIPWTFMSQAMTASSQSLVTGQNMLGKSLFPPPDLSGHPHIGETGRLSGYPCDRCWYHRSFLLSASPPPGTCCYLPLFIGLMMCVAAGVGVWLSAMAIRFRDVKLAMPFVIHMLMYHRPDRVFGIVHIRQSSNPLLAESDRQRHRRVSCSPCWDSFFLGVHPAGHDQCRCSPGQRSLLFPTDGTGVRRRHLILNLRFLKHQRIRVFYE